MSTHIVYSIGIGSLENWHNVCGEKLNINNLGESYTIKGRIPVFETRDLKRLSPFYSKRTLLETSDRIDNYMKDFIKKSCEVEDDFKDKYYSSFYGILRAATSLNVIPEDSKDYVQYHLRVEQLILQTLRALSNMSTSEVIDLFDAVKSNNIGNVMKSCYDGTLASLLMIAMVKDDDSHDYEIFTYNPETEEEIIDTEALTNLLFAKLAADMEINYQDYKVILEEKDPSELQKVLLESHGNSKKLVPYFANFSRLSIDDIKQLKNGK